MMTAYLVTLSALTAVVLLVRAILRGKLPARVTYALWLAVVLRMCLPVFLFEIPLPQRKRRFVPRKKRISSRKPRETPFCPLRQMFPSLRCFRQRKP